MTNKKPVLIRVSKSAPDPTPRSISTSKVIASAWDSVRACIPPEMHPDDIENQRRAFYAGAYSVLDTLINTDCLDEKRKGATQTDKDRVGAMWWEVCDFLNALANGKTPPAADGETSTVQ